MDRLIVKVFGINRTNLWGWVCAGLLVMGGAGVFFLLGYGAFLNRDVDSTLIWLLSGVALLLLGQFGIALQTYCSLLAEKLERQQARVPDLDYDAAPLPAPYPQPGTHFRERQT
jgi:hypothetical protein